MKIGKSLTELATELERQKPLKRDFIAGSGALAMSPDAKGVIVRQNGVPEQFALTTVAKNQIAGRLEIPNQFYQRLEEKHPDILADTVTKLFQREPKKLMVRTLEGRARAFLSNSYRVLDNYDLAEAVLPVLQQSGAEVVSAELTERRMYIKALLPWLNRELPVPEGLKMGVGHNFFVRKIEGAITISGSEVGMGMVSVQPGIFEKQCTNLASFRDEGFGRVHIGKKNAVDAEGAWEYASDDTKRLADLQVWALVRDMVKATVDGRVYEKLVTKLTAARGDLIEQDPAKVVEVFAKQNGLNDDERGGVLKHLAQGGELTRYGLQWAVTRLAGEVEDYDRATELERLGGQVIELAPTDWNEILKKAA